MHEVQDPPPARQNSRACDHSYNNYSKAKKWSLHRFRSSKISRQSIQGIYNKLLPRYKPLAIPPPHTKYNDPAALAISWIILPRY